MSTYITLPVLPELLESDLLSLTIKEELLLDVFFVIRQKLLSTKVCELPVVSSELELLAESSFFEQEMMVKLKRNMEKMMSRCFTWFPISGLGEPNIYQNLVCFTRNRQMPHHMLCHLHYHYCKREKYWAL